MKIQENETKIVGHWMFGGSKMLADKNCERIDWLRSNYLKLISTDESGWLNLYQDPGDKRYWQLDFEHGEMHGGGPPSLIVLSEDEARTKYDF
ncbi:MAG: Imm27 family immunity protein [Mucilaginibacter sp.]